MLYSFKVIAAVFLYCVYSRWLWCEFTDKICSTYCHIDDWWLKRWRYHLNVHDHFQCNCCAPCDSVIGLRIAQFEQLRATTAYKLPNYNKAKRLWKLAVEHHAFFRHVVSYFFLFK